MRSRVIGRSEPTSLPTLAVVHLDCGHSCGVARDVAPPDGAEVECEGCAPCACGGLGRIADAPCRCRLGDAGREVSP